MSKTIARGLNNDISLFMGQIAMTEGKNAQAQIIEAAVLAVKGEMQYDTERGIPYFDTVFKRQNNINLWKAYVISRVKEFPWVVDIPSFEYNIDYANKRINYTMTIQTNDGETTVSGISD